jgi:hypothetical protein
MAVGSQPVMGDREATLACRGSMWCDVVWCAGHMHSYACRAACALRHRQAADGTVSNRCPTQRRASHHKGVDTGRSRRSERPARRRLRRAVPLVHARRRRGLTRQLIHAARKSPGTASASWRVHPQAQNRELSSREVTDTSKSDTYDEYSHEPRQAGRGQLESQPPRSFD